MIYVDGNEVGLFNVRTNKRTVITVFKDYLNLQFGPGKGNPSMNGNWIALAATEIATGKMVAFAYDLKNKVKYPDIDLSGVSTIKYVTISPQANYIVVTGLYGNDTRQVYDLMGNMIGSGWKEKGVPSHCDLTIDLDGKEIAVGVAKDGSKKTIKRSLSDGIITPIGPAVAHTSARNILRPGWVYGSMPYSDGSIYADEILAIRLDGQKVERLAYLPNSNLGYDTEVHAVPSPDGKYVMAASNWNDQSGMPVNAYVI